MDWKTFEDGKAGRPMADGADLKSYLAGQQERHQPAGPKVEVPGSAFTLIIVSPLIWVVYPVLGLVAMAPFAAIIALAGGWSAAGPGAFLVGVLLGAAAFFFGLRLEARASQFAPYRVVRMVMRWAGALVARFTFAASPDMNPFHIDIDRAPPPTLFTALILVFVVHYVFRTLDRLYFPVWKHVEANYAVEASGQRLERPRAKRILYTFLWILPGFALLNLAIRLVVDAATDGPAARVAFYRHYEGFVYLADVVVWVLLAFFGILPGTSRYRRSFVDHGILLANRDGGPPAP